MRFILCLSIFFFSISCLGQTLWTGPTMSFSKEDYADWMVEENQDRITDLVWLTRADNKGIFNFVLEEEYDNITDNSPLGTEWANGSIADGIENLNFMSWFASNPDSPVEEIGKPKVLHLIEEDIYIDLVFTAWTQGGGGSGTGFGGGFSYQRSTPSVVKTLDIQTPSIVIFPNPTSSFINIEGAPLPNEMKIFNTQGKVVYQEKVNTNLIDLSSFNEGLYFIYIPQFPIQKLFIQRK